MQLPGVPHLPPPGYCFNKNRFLIMDIQLIVFQDPRKFLINHIEPKVRTIVVPM